MTLREKIQKEIDGLGIVDLDELLKFLKKNYPIIIETLDEDEIYYLWLG